MSINWKQFHAGVVLPALRDLAIGPIPYSESADRLVSETIWHESDQLTALGQWPLYGMDQPWPFGPGLGVASIEQPTWDWMCGTPLGRELLAGCDYRELVWDLRLNVAACRLRYFLDKRPLPGLIGGMEARADYWQTVYNRGPADRRYAYKASARLLKW